MKPVMMNKAAKALRRALRTAIACLVMFACSTFADIQLDELKTSDGTYKNVKVFNRTATHLSFAHSRGVAVIQLKELDEETLARIDQRASSPGDDAGGLVLRGKNEKSEGYTPIFDSAQIKSFTAALSDNPFLKYQLEGIDRTAVFISLGVMLGFWLFFSYCSSLICKKAGTDPGVLVWLPVFQLIPLIRAAGMSGWWFLAWFIPALNIIASVLWCIRIADARGKSPWVGVFLILPVTNVLAFLYLAFSNGNRRTLVGTAPLGAPRVQPA